MKESSKTSIFLSVALLFGVLAFFLKPGVPQSSSENMIGKPLFEKFTDPLEIKGLEIAKYNTLKSGVDEFRINELNEVWTIPSHGNYPVDAKEQMAAAGTSLIDLEVLSVINPSSNEAGTVGEMEKFHALYGVLDPKDQNLGFEDGIGTKITVLAKDDSTLVDMIVGKELEDNPEIRYVRVAGSDTVFTVKLSLEKFSTKFEDWIERNLLDIKSWDIRYVQVNDYYVDMAERVQRNRGSSLINFDPQDRWTLGEYAVFRNGRLNVVPLPLDRELNTEALDGMTKAIDDLKIVDVRRKPEKLATALRESKQLDRDAEVEQLMVMYGYYNVPIPDPDDPNYTIISLISNEGEMSLTLENGVSYILRFGALSGTQSETVEETLDSNGNPKQTTRMTANRYLFVMADFKEAMIKKPDLLPVPDPITEGTPEEIKAREDAIRKIELTNQREQDRYDEAVKEGQEKAHALNARFADWFYIISEDVFKRIHLDWNTLFKVKEQPNEPGESNEKKQRELPNELGMGEMFPLIEPEKPVEVYDPLGDIEEIPGLETIDTKPE